MCNPMRTHAAIGELHQVEPRYTRGQGEVSDTDGISVTDAVVMPLQSIERTPKQTGSDLGVDSFGSSEGKSSSEG